MSDRKASLIAGLLAGIIGLLVFLGLHHLWIMPIWFILPPGLAIATAGGLAIGWAYSELLPRLPRQPWTIFAWSALVGITLIPSIVLAEMEAPLFRLTGENATLTVSIGQAAVIFVGNLLLTATVAGGLAGWLIGRTRRAALATALAGFVFALGPGHNIPFLGNTPGMGKGILLILAIIWSASVVLVEAQAVLAGGKVIANKFNRYLHNSNNRV